MNRSNARHIRLSLPLSLIKSQGNSPHVLLAQLDSITREHSIRVGKLAGKFGELLGLQHEERAHLATAGLFHDIGKIAIDRKILYKKEPLLTHEKNVIQSHPELGAKIWLQIGGYYRISEAILCHHENYAGSGYPFGLTGEDIPRWARIIAIADALDAMLSARPYREPCSVQQTLQTILDGSGQQFDPYLLARLYKSLRDRGFLLLCEK